MKSATLSVCAPVMDGVFQLTQPPIVLDIPSDPAQLHIPETESDFLKDASLSAIMSGSLRSPSSSNTMFKSLFLNKNRVSPSSE
jgi:hypothetical protein